MQNISAPAIKESTVASPISAIEMNNRIIAAKKNRRKTRRLCPGEWPFISPVSFMLRLFRNFPDLTRRSRDVIIIVAKKPVSTGMKLKSGESVFV